MIESRKAQMGQGGFTLIELLVVVAILAVLGGAAIIGIGQMRENAETTVCETDQSTLRTAAYAALVDNPGFTVTDDDGSDPALAAYLPEPATTGATVSVAAGGIVSTGGC